MNNHTEVLIVRTGICAGASQILLITTEKPPVRIFQRSVSAKEYSDMEVNMAAGIYIHIPFCVRKCFYCDFVSGIGNQDTMRQYQSALLNEIESTVIDETVDSVFLGGGTPSVYPVVYIEEIMNKLSERYALNPADAEITIECNPGTLTDDKLAAYKAVGINRISIGLQSANDYELNILGRIHTYEEFRQSYDMVRKTGFENINVDIMSAIPNQSLNSYQETVEKVVRLEPEHISAYSLIIEEGTVFTHQYGSGTKGEKELPDEDTDREMYHWTKDYLSQNGYERYEISNYAKAGKACRHNLKYWSRDNYYGFGIAASSLADNVRYTNTGNIEEYLSYHGETAHIRAVTEKIDIKGQMEEYMFLGLRKMQGICIEEFYQMFHTDMHQIYGVVLNKMCENGLMDCRDGYYRLSERGIDVSNMVLCEFLL